MKSLLALLIISTSISTSLFAETSEDLCALPSQNPCNSFKKYRNLFHQRKMALETFYLEYQTKIYDPKLINDIDQIINHYSARELQVMADRIKEDIQTIYEKDMNTDMITTTGGVVAMATFYAGAKYFKDGKNKAKKPPSKFFKKGPMSKSSVKWLHLVIKTGFIFSAIITGISAWNIYKNIQKESDLNAKIERLEHISRMASNIIARQDEIDEMSICIEVQQAELLNRQLATIEGLKVVCTRE